MFFLLAGAGHILHPFSARPSLFRTVTPPPDIASIRSGSTNRCTYHTPITLVFRPRLTQHQDTFQMK